MREISTVVTFYGLLYFENIYIYIFKFGYGFHSEKEKGRKGFTFGMRFQRRYGMSLEC